MGRPLRAVRLSLEGRADLPGSVSPFRVRFGLWMIPALVIVIAVGCGEAGEAEPEAEAAAAAEPGLPFDSALAGHVVGRVSFEGALSGPMEDPGVAACPGPGQVPGDLNGIRGEDGGLAGAFIHVKEGLEDLAFPLAQEPVVIEARGCRLVPPMVGMMANQTLTLRNSDPVEHRLQASPDVNRPFQVSLPTQGREANRTFSRPEVLVPVTCEVHGWMRGWVGVVPHPYHAVSDGRGGFALEGLPPGEYLIEAWHPELGAREARVTVRTGETTEVALSFPDAG